MMNFETGNPAIMNPNMNPYASPYDRDGVMDFETGNPTLSNPNMEIYVDNFVPEEEESDWETLS